MKVFYLVSSESSRVHQLVETKAEKFEVAPPLLWIEHDKLEGLEVGDLEYSDGAVSKIPAPVEQYDLARRMNFPFYAEQLDMLWHDMDTGKIAGKETSTWYAAVKAIKEQYPKP